MSFQLPSLTTVVKYQNLADLSDFLLRRMAYKQITIKFSQNDYDDFIEDLDTLQNIYVGKFRPTKVDPDDDETICQWVFNGSLKLKIKIEE